MRELDAVLPTTFAAILSAVALLVVSKGEFNFDLIQGTHAPVTQGCDVYDRVATAPKTKNEFYMIFKRARASYTYAEVVLLVKLCGPHTRIMSQ